MTAPTYSLVTLTLFKYQGWNKAWAFSQMGLMPPRLRKIPGLNFFRLLGSGGGNGFSAKLQFAIYSLLAVWQNPSAAETFFTDSPVYQQFKNHSDNQFTTYLQPIQVKGGWDGPAPFRCAASSLDNKPIAVLTRATLRWQHIVPFWRATPDVSHAISKQPGAQLAIGLGEIPWLRQATFSIWENAAAIEEFAYKNQLHKEVMVNARQQNWYKEDLFARFLVLEQRGQW